MKVQQQQGSPLPEKDHELTDWIAVGSGTIADLRHRFGLMSERIERLEQQVYERKIPRPIDQHEELMNKLFTLQQMISCVMDEIAPKNWNTNQQT